MRQLGASDEEFFGPGGDEVSCGVSSKETSESGDDPADVDAIDILDDHLFSEGDTDFDVPGEEMVDVVSQQMCLACTASLARWEAAG